MKNILRLLLIILCLGVCSVVNAATSSSKHFVGESNIVSDVETCEYTGDVAYVFMYDDKCFISGIKEGEVVIETNPADTALNLPATTVITQFSKGTISSKGKVTLAELSYIINTGQTSKKIKEKKMADEKKPEGATAYEIKAAYDESHLYLYVGYDNSDKEVFTFGFDAENNKLNLHTGYAKADADSAIEDHSMKDAEDVTFEVADASFETFKEYGPYMFEYLKEASPEYAAASAITADEAKLNIIDKATTKALNDKYVSFEVEETESGGSISFEMTLSNQYNEELVGEYDKVIAAQEAAKKAEQPTEKNPDTSDYLVVAVICAVLFVIIALVHQNKAKMLEN